MYDNCILSLYDVLTHPCLEVNKTPEKKPSLSTPSWLIFDFIGICRWSSSQGPLGTIAEYISSERRPMRYGEPASPKAWDRRICRASAVPRHVGFTTYNTMSATMLQLRFRETSPRKMRTNARTTWLSQRMMPKVRNNAEIRMPAPQMIGSALGYTALNLVDNSMPKGTPTMPESMVTKPKMKGTLVGSSGLSSSARVFRPRSI